MKISIPFLLLCLLISCLLFSCNAQKKEEASQSVIDYFQEIPEKYRFGYTIEKEGAEWLSKDDQVMPVQSRKVVLLEKSNYLQVGLSSIPDLNDSVCVKIFPTKTGNIVGISHFGSRFDLNGGQVWGEIFFLKKENGSWKEINVDVLPDVSIQDFYNEKISQKEGYVALQYIFGENENIAAQLMVSYSAELDCMGGRNGAITGKIQKEGCLLTEKKKRDKILLKYNRENGKFSK